MEPLRRAAFLSVGRGCAFASLAIVCTLVGFSYDPVVVTRVGGVLTTLMTIVLIMRARVVVRLDYRRTELWLLLDKKDRPPAALAQWASATALREAYLFFAHYSAATAIAFWLMALLFSLLGLGSVSLR